MFQDATAKGRTNLVADGTSFVGRGADLAALDADLRGGARLITLVGPAGTGKTRLACELGLRLVDAFPGGVWFCSLADETDSHGFLRAVAVALGVPTAGADPAEVMAQTLAQREKTLLILDNLEQLVEACAPIVSGWCHRAPELRVLATSRELLRLPIEIAYALAPLGLPEAGSDADSPAVRLFLDRAPAPVPPAERATVAEIVRRLDGLPLAIELAAAQIGILSPRQLHENLPARFELLVGGSSASERQATLRGAIEWSWKLLAPWEREALAQCSIFRGGFTLEAAEAILDLRAHRDAPCASIAVQALRDKSLLRSYEPPELPGELRFGMFESIREYAGRQLGLGSAATLARRHAAWYLEKGRSWADGSLRHGGVEKAHRLSLERENLLAIHRRALEQSPVSAEAASWALRAVLALQPILSARVPAAFNLGLFDEALDAAPLARTEVALRAEALATRGRARLAAGRPAGGLADLQEAITLARGIGDQVLEGRALLDLSRHHRYQGRLDEGRVICERSIALLRAAGDRVFEGRAVGCLAMLLHEGGHLTEARAYFDEALEIHREVGDRRSEGIILGSLGGLAADLGDMAESTRCLEASLDALREAGDILNEAAILDTLACHHHAAGQHERAYAEHERALQLTQTVGARRLEGTVLISIGGALQQVGRLHEARRRYEEALAILRVIGDTHYQGIANARLASLDAQAGELESAWRRFDRAEAALRDANDVLGLATVSVDRGHLDLALALLALHEGHAAEATNHVETARRRLADTDAAKGSEDGRCSIRLLQAALERAPR